MLKRAEYNRGQALLVVVAIFAVLAGVVGMGSLGVVVSNARDIRGLLGSKRSYFLAESGAEDALYRLKNNQPISASEVLNLDNGSATTTVTDLVFDKQIKGIGNFDQSVRKVAILLTLGEGASFNFGVQSDQGGFLMTNSSAIKGNVYSNGIVRGEGSSLIMGDVISAGPAGLVDGIHATGTAYAHSITASTIGKDAYYTSISGTTVGGQLFPGSPDQATSSLPIPDSLIEEWKAAASAGDYITGPCPYAIKSKTVSIGPARISCDLEIESSDVTLTGALWVEGNITLKTTSEIKVDPSLGNRAVPVIADKESNRLTGSLIETANTVKFLGNGGANSYIMLLSQNNSAENGGDVNAITAGQSSQGGDLLLYAGHGKISLGNNTNLRQVTGYKIDLGNNTTVEYKTGMTSLIFATGPGGTWDINSWQEVEN